MEAMQRKREEMEETMKWAKIDISMLDGQAHWGETSNTQNAEKSKRRLR
jgi:hypothetical protein